MSLTAGNNAFMADGPTSAWRGMVVMRNKTNGKSETVAAHFMPELGMVTFHVPDYMVGEVDVEVVAMCELREKSIDSSTSP